MLRSAVYKGRSITFLLLLLIVINLMAVFAAQLQRIPGGFFQELSQGAFGNLQVIFFSIIIEALPFVILGVLGSTLLEVFVSPELIQRLLPRTWFLGIMVSGLLGFLFPFCECGLVPIVKRLMEKGVPAPLATVFLLTAPVVNPVVGMATHFAFMRQPEFVLWRLGGAYLLAITVGFLLLRHWSERLPLKPGTGYYCGCGFSHGNELNRSFGGKIRRVFAHSQEEFFGIVYYLIIGAFLASASQVFLPREWLTQAGSHATGSVGVMMSMAFLLSLCSGADAFVANTFVNTFTPGSILAFMIFGPMVDLKNLLMMLAVFKKRFVITLVFWVATLSFLLGVAINKTAVMIR
ncbi:permease [Desulforamulus ruminis]|uniref:Permease n=1 Tax=Desulforamulus ruminis (strain ATCC 23193 / DSM 2154 / NCIMB 8452 / DL) TaxID=696281 RepID=F6DKM7_DESRL|nr:permease [Desulforamulus ruminis]AEG60402.1 permease [Desulforamulus ruminis DSM 2154]